MFVRIDMVQREPGRTKRLELCRDLGGELALRPGIHRKIDAGQDHILAKVTRSLDEIRHGVRRKSRNAVDQHKMQSDAESGKAARAAHGVGRRCAGHHQAGSGQDAIAMGLFDRFIYFRRGAEIIRRNDQRFQAWLRRARKNWKNSTPSRSRRFIISGLAIISPTIDAIFDGRK